MLAGEGVVVPSLGKVSHQAVNWHSQLATQLSERKVVYSLLFSYLILCAESAAGGIS